MRAASRIITRPRFLLFKSLTRTLSTATTSTSYPSHQLRPRLFKHQNLIAASRQPCRYRVSKRRSSENGKDETFGARAAISVTTCVREIDDLLLQQYSFNTFKARPGLVLRDDDYKQVVSLFKRCSPLQRNDIFAWMARNGRQKGALWLIEQILERVALETSMGNATTPSNLAWPRLQHLSNSPSTCHELHRPHPPQSARMADIDTWFDKNEFFRPGAADQYEMMSYIWLSLTRLVLDTMNMSALEAREIMSFVLIVLAAMHRLDLMPQDIYQYEPSAVASGVQRPPILHMVSSRVLQSLSDAVWRDLQDEAVKNAVKQLGVSLQEVLKQPPGGRFRPVVKPLAPELWIEMFLWCCVEAGNAHAAVHILKMLQQDTQKPWFAIRWNRPNAHGTLQGHIDWDRVELRTGGTVGRVEGYSHDEPFVTIPERTVSVEAVLAVIETLISSNVVTTDPLLKSSQIRSTIHKIAKVASLLEPHDLPRSYFDYLGTRLLHLDAFDMALQPVVLRKWSQLLREIMSLATIAEPCRHQSLELDSILTHGKAHAGIQHQALDGLVQIGDVHNSLALFNEIQEAIDRSKVNDIEEFLGAENELVVKEADTYETETGGELLDPEYTEPVIRPAAQLQPDVLEYAHSHGQLPLHKVAGLLNLISDNNLVGLGQWMLYADELDGPLVPESVYHHSSFTAALYRFASVSGDTELLNRVMEETTSSKRLPSVRVLRALVNAQITVGDYNLARRVLRQLAMALGGGPSPMNVAHLAANILRLERVDKDKLNNDQLANFDESLSEACSLMIELMRGRYDAKTSSFRTDQIAAYRQQIAHVLRLMFHVEGSVLSRISQLYISKFNAGNQASLPVSVFNKFLAAVVETRSAREGLDFWFTFCKLDQGLELGDISSTKDADEGSPLQPAHDGLAVSTAPVSRGAVKPEFANPFFKHAPTKDAIASFELEVRDLQHVLADRRQDAAITKRARAMLTPLPLTQPNLQTVRIILRAATAERQGPIYLGQSPKTGPGRIFNDWALDTLSKYGLTGEMMAQEVATPLSMLQAQYPKFELQSDEDESAVDSYTPFEGATARFQSFSRDALPDASTPSRDVGRESALWSR